MSLLEVHGLAFSYGEKTVFEDVSFCVDAGEVFCLVGPNGCGKTTLVHCILAHLTPRAGEVLFDGEPASGLSARKLAKKVAYVPQNHVRSFPYRTVDVVAMGRTREQGFLSPDGGCIEDALAVMKRLGIDHLAETEYTTLSGGELQMALIARALVQESAVLVFDEPTTHLDVRRAQDVIDVLARLARDEGKAIVLSTHDFNVPLALQDVGVDVKMTLMEGGRLSEADSPIRLLSSGCLHDAYGVESQVVEVVADVPRHYLAVWNEGVKR